MNEQGEKRNRVDEAGLISPGVIKSATVVVRRQWNDFRLAVLRIDDLHSLHFSDLSGGVYAKSPRPFLHGYCSCDAFIDGEVAHSCRHGSAPHWIKVCVVKKDNSKQVYTRLAELARTDPKRK